MKSRKLIGRVAMRVLAAAAIIWSVGSLFSRATIGAPQNDYLVVPRQRVSVWALGDPIETYGLGQPRFQFQVSDQGIPWRDLSLFSPTPDYYLEINACRGNPRSIGIFVVRQNHYPPGENVAKFRTPEGVRIGMSVNDVVRLLGQPPKRNEWKERHAQTDVVVDSFEYQGLQVRINRAEGRVFGLGAVNDSAYDTCWMLHVAPSGGSATTPAILKAIASRANMSISDDIRITAPGPEVPPQIAAASGMWDGTDCRPRQIFAIEAITLAYVRIFYAWWTPSSTGWVRLSGIYNNKFIMVREKFTVSQGEVQKSRTFQVVAEDTLFATNSVTGAEGAGYTECKLRRVRQ